MTSEEFLSKFDSIEIDFEMFTKQGNKKAKSITRQLIKKVFSKKRITQHELEEKAANLLAKAYLDERYSEILDSEPPYHIRRIVREALSVVGYNFADLDIGEDKVYDQLILLKK